MKFRTFLLIMIALANFSDGLAADTNRLAAPVSAVTNAPPGKSHTFEVKGYEIRGNTILSYDQMAAVFTNYLGSAVTLETIRKALGAFQLAYRNRGYVTVSVALPRQQLTNGLVKVQVTEGKISDITISGNRHYSQENIRRALPSLTTNVMLNTKWFQPELDRANASQDRQIYPVLAPGPDPGTTALGLKVKDRFPLHGHVELNNKATPGTPPLRFDTALQYNNLWQREHQIGLQYNFSPGETKSEDQWPRFFDQPEVASYSGFYRVPLSFGHALREDYDKLPVDFGYDQVTHTFRLPPPTGNSEVIVYASRSSSENPTRFGPVTSITSNVLAEISSQFAQRDLTTTENLGSKFTVPLREFHGVRSSVSFGADYKTYQAQSFSTNFNFYRKFNIDGFGNRVFDREEITPLDSLSDLSLKYVPLSLGWSASRPDKRGSTSFNVSENLFLSELASERKGFQSVAGSKHAGGNYTTLIASLTREQTLPRDWSLLFRANGQWSSAPLIGNEQFALGGTAGVRGYQEGEEYGDAGWRALFDLRAPPVGIGYLPKESGDIPVHLRCSTFFDFGERYLFDPSPLRKHREQMMGAGVSFYATAGQHFDTRLTLAWALLDTPGSRAGAARAYFSVGIQF